MPDLTQIFPGIMRTNNYWVNHSTTKIPMRIIIPFLVALLPACQTTPQLKEVKPDTLIDDDHGEYFHYQVWEHPNGKRYIKELNRGTIKEWD